MKTKLSFDYLKKTACWQDWRKPTLEQLKENPRLKDKVIGRYYYIGWYIKDGTGKDTVMEAWTKAILCKEKATNYEKLVAKTDGLAKAWREYKKALQEKKFISIAPVLEIPKKYKGTVHFI